MQKGFYYVMAAQFFSALADNALLIAAIGLLAHLAAPLWVTPLLKLFFVVSYVVLAPFVGPFADSRPKGKVMMITNYIKLMGALLLVFSGHPGMALFAYAVVGFGAAAYSPAKYGIITEMLPPEKLVVANGWIEGLTVLAIISGTVLGGLLIDQHVWNVVSAYLPTSWFTHQAQFALFMISSVYLIATAINYYIPDTGVRYQQPKNHTVKLLTKNFIHAFNTLWKDPLGQISLAMTTLFWGAGATLQFIVLKWAEESLHLPLSKGAILQAIVAFGVAAGAILAARKIPLRKTPSVLKYGILLGLLVMLMTTYSYDSAPAWLHDFKIGWLSLFFIPPMLFLTLVGAVSGFFVVPMNALLQHRGYVLLSAGSSIAVQNFNEHLSILAMLGLYSLLIWLNVPTNNIILLFGATVAGLSYVILRWHQANQRVHDSVAELPDGHHG